MRIMYFAHIAVQCDDSGKYVSGGDIIFPLSWDTEEKKNSAVLRDFRFHRDKPVSNANQVVAKKMSI